MGRIIYLFKIFIIGLEAIVLRMQYFPYSQIIIIILIIIMVVA
jgi:hypothetical protein